MNLLHHLKDNECSVKIYFQESYRIINAMCIFVSIIIPTIGLCPNTNFIDTDLLSWLKINWQKACFIKHTQGRFIM